MDGQNGQDESGPARAGKRWKASCSPPCGGQDESGPARAGRVNSRSLAFIRGSSSSPSPENGGGAMWGRRVGGIQKVNGLGFMKGEAWNPRRGHRLGIDGAVGFSRPSASPTSADVLGFSSFLWGDWRISSLFSMGVFFKTV
jgi:hypothetical protein